MVVKVSAEASPDEVYENVKKSLIKNLIFKQGGPGSGKGT